MPRAWYEHGQDEAPPLTKELKQDFLILVDSHLKAKNFISFEETYQRERSRTLDTSSFHWHEEWNRLTPKEKIKEIKRKKQKAREASRTIHRANNQRQQQVWIINNTTDTVSIQMQDWSFICILQALTKGGHWCPIEYWGFSDCGNSYYNKPFPPKTANSFVTNLPDKGDYPTKLRYKLLGKDRFYYSNEFDGKINYCDFAIDSMSETHPYHRRDPHFMLDSLINLVY